MTCGSKAHWGQRKYKREDVFTFEDTDPLFFLFGMVERCRSQHGSLSNNIGNRTSA